MPSTGGKVTRTVKVAPYRRFRRGRHVTEARERRLPATRARRATIAFPAAFSIGTTLAGLGSARRRSDGGAAAHRPSVAESWPTGSTIGAAIRSTIRTATERRTRRRPSGPRRGPFEDRAPRQIDPALLVDLDDPNHDLVS